MSNDDLEHAATEREAAMRGLQPYQVRANRAVPDSLIRDIVGDSRRGPAAPSSLASHSQSSEPERPASGGAVEVRPPAGIDYIDRMCAEQDRADRAAAI